jgi:ADP-heptose:LPS heptosyltransferase
VKRLLAVNLGGIDDVVATGPALERLGRVLPKAKITLLTSPSGGMLACLFPQVRHVLTYRPGDLDRPLADPEQERAMIDALYARSFDAAVIFTRRNQSPYLPAYLCTLADIPVRLGQTRVFGGNLLSPCVEPPTLPVPPAAHHLFLLEAAGLGNGLHAEWALPAEVQQAGDVFLEEAGIDAGTEFILLAGGSGDVAYAATVYALQDGGRVSLVAPMEGEDRVLERMPDHVRSIPIPEFVAVLNRAALILSADAQLLRLARVLRRPASAWKRTHEWEGRGQRVHRQLSTIPMEGACHRYAF